MKRLFFLVLSLFAFGLSPPASGQVQTPEPCPCSWWQNDDDYLGVITSQNVFRGPGIWAAYQCYPQTFPPGATEAPPPVRCVIAAPWSAVDLRRLGDRLDTIRNAADWKAAARTAWRRYVTLPLTDPSLAEIVKAIRADEARQLRDMGVAVP